MDGPTLAVDKDGDKQIHMIVGHFGGKVNDNIL